jgi:DNA-binding response OmpR family regulator
VKTRVDHAAVAHLSWCPTFLIRHNVNPEDRSVGIRNVSVLIVDNDRHAVATLALLLSDAGCHVSYTFDPRLALALARKCKPDIAFIDLRMPHMTGFTLAKVFRAERALDACALVAFSGFGGDYSWAIAGSDFQALLSKPAPFEEVVAAIEMLVPAAKDLQRQSQSRPDDDLKGLAAQLCSSSDAT